MTNWRQQKKQLTDPAEWTTFITSWLIYLGGLFFFTGTINTWVLLALGALPVLITAWFLGMFAAAVASLISISIHLAADLLLNQFSLELGPLIFHHLVAFTLMAIAGIFTGHLRELQIRSQGELRTLSAKNLVLSRLTRTLEATNLLVLELIGSADWLGKVQLMLNSIGRAAEVDHLVLIVLSGEGTENYTAMLAHYLPYDPSTPGNHQERDLHLELLDWIENARNGIPRKGRMKELSSDLRDYLSFAEEGEYAVFPIFTNTTVWGFLGFENNRPDDPWQEAEIGTFRSIAQTLGSIIYKKLIDEHVDLRAKELKSLEKTRTNISSSDQLENSLQTVLTQILDLTPAYDANVYLYKNRKLEFLLSMGKNHQGSLPFSHSGEADLSQLAATTKQDLYISNLQHFSDLATSSANQEEAVIAFPLKAASEVIGILNIWYAKPRSFEEEEKTILRLLADQAAMAIINIQFITAEREQRLLADSLRKANLQLSDKLELKGVLENILIQVLNLVSARDSQIFLFDGIDLSFGAVMYAENVPHDPVHPPTRDSLFYQAAKEGQLTIVPDIQLEEHLPANWKSGSLISLPLIFHKNVIGIMNVTFFEPGDPDEQTLQVLDLLSNQAAIAINNARTYEAEREQRRLAQALQSTGRAIQSSLDLEVVLDQILTQIATVIPYYSSNLILFEEGNAKMVRQQGFQEDQKSPELPTQVELFDITRFSTLKKMAQTKKPLIIADTENDSDWVKTSSTERILSWAGAPILDGDLVIGFLSLNSQIRHFYRPEHADVLSAFASQASIALTHARLHNEIQEMAITDPLTNLFNRRGLNRWGQYEIERAQRFGSKLSAVFLDLDNFKSINDTYGHDTGDVVLKAVVSSCRNVIRKIDIFSRIGGDEFLVILPETPLDIALQVAERLRGAVAEQVIKVNTHQVQTTISLGVVELTPEIQDLPELINEADRFMYLSKQAGCNRISFPGQEEKIPH
jgi:diguanylate cyclase (GGDEF)-like protein